MDKKSLLVLTHLRQDARQGLTSISRKTSIPISTLHDRVKQFRNYFIIKHTALLDFAKLGFNARANILIRINKEEKEKLKGFLSKNHNINSFYKINNGYDFMVEVVFKYLREVEEFIENLEENFKIKSKEVFYIIDEIKREAFLSDPNLVDIMRD